MYVLMNRPSSDGDIAALRAREVEEVVLPAVLLAPGNPSPYNFLRGLYSELAPASPLCGDGNVLKVRALGGRAASVDGSAEVGSCRITG